MKSAGSCFPNCPDFLQDFVLLMASSPFKTTLYFLSFPSYSSYCLSLQFSFLFLGFSFLFSWVFSRSVSLMGMAAATDSQFHHQFHVLAVDDSLIDRKLIERLLKTSSYHVTAVDSGSKALEFLGLNEEYELQRISNPTSVSPDHNNYNHHQDLEVNLIITDYCMPGMTGYDLLRKIKESKSFKDIPVVIMSSENVPSRINRCLEEGAEEFFLKPVQLSDVIKLRPHLMKGKATETESNNKRKGDEEIHSPDKSRTRFNNNNNGLEVVNLID